MLHRLVTLNISDCTKITDLTNLNHLQDLTCTFGMVVADTKAFQNRSIFGRLQRLTTTEPGILYRTRFFQENWLVLKLTDLLHLELRHCQFIHKFSNAEFPKLRTLKLVSCNLFSSLSVLPPLLEVLTIESCSGLQCLTVRRDSSEQTIYAVIVTQCSELTFVSTKCKIFRMEPNPSAIASIFISVGNGDIL
jgi:hypothetical protein